MNRIANVANRFQGDSKKVLCVCSAGLLRSPTAAEVLSREPFSFNTRAAGMASEYALICVDDVLLAWADEIVCMENAHAEILRRRVDNKLVLSLDIEDDFVFRDPNLQRLVAERYLAFPKAEVP